MNNLLEKHKTQRHKDFENEEKELLFVNYDFKSKNQ